MSEWNASLYDNKHGFVAEYGKGLLEFGPETTVSAFWIWDAEQER